MRRSCRARTRSRRRRPSTTRAGGRKLPDEGRVLTLGHASGGDGRRGLHATPRRRANIRGGVLGSCGFVWVVGC
jgi:hypothetical protein